MFCITGGFDDRLKEVKLPLVLYRAPLGRQIMLLLPRALPWAEECWPFGPNTLAVSAIDSR